MIKETSEFLLIARKELAESLKNITSPKKFKSLKQYIMNEASDYEIIHTLVYNKPPKHKYDKIRENLAWADFKVFISENWSGFNKVFKRSVLFEMLDMNPLLPYGLSSSIPMMEFAMATGKLDMINEADDITIDQVREASKKWLDAKETNKLPDEEINKL